jgi:hypothetical protein
MKGRNARKTGGVVMKNSAPTDVYAGANSEVVKEAKGGTNGFKKGGKAMGKVHGEAAKMNAGRKPRKAGGGVFSTASSGSPRKASSHY